MKVLLADPPAKGTKIDDSYSNLGLLYLAGSLKAVFRQNELEVRYVGPHHTLKSHLEIVKDFQPQIYGLSFASKAAGKAYETMKAVNQVSPQTWIVAGGPHSTALPMDVFKYSPVKIIVPGEGEFGFTEVVKAVAGESCPNLESIAGIFYRRNGEIRQTTSRPLAENIDAIPFPAWELIDFREYPGMHLKKQPIETSMLISRGCPFQCTFCSQPIWKYQKPWLRVRSPENVWQKSSCSTSSECVRFTSLLTN